MSFGGRPTPLLLLLLSFGVACSGSPTAEPPADWDFFTVVVHVEWTGESVVRPSGVRDTLRAADGIDTFGVMEIALADGTSYEVQVRTPARHWDGPSGRCRPLDAEMWAADYDDCWMAGTVAANGDLAEWETFSVSRKGVFDLPLIEEVAEGGVVIRGRTFPIADDFELDRRCCDSDLGESWKDLIGRVVPEFDPDRGRIVSASCPCRA